MSALVIEKLNCFYQENQILKDLDLSLKNNEIVCLLGESGCGKTTLLRAVAGLQRETSGCISINSKTVDSDSFSLPPDKRKVGLIFQDYALFPHLNVFDNVAFSLTKISKEKKTQRVKEVLSLVHLSDYALRFPHQLSGGQQQRIAIARALAYQPELMLLDEPFSNLDQHVRFQLISDIRHLLKSRKMSALFVTHSKEEGFAFADKIALMQAGKIKQIDNPQRLYRSPKSRYVADFMGISNYLPVYIDDDYFCQSKLGKIKTNMPITHEKGSKLDLLLRPEQLMITVNKRGKGIIEKIDFLGSHIHITVSYFAKLYIVKQSTLVGECAPLNLGDKVTLSVHCHDLVLFDRT